MRMKRWKSAEVLAVLRLVLDAVVVLACENHVFHTRQFGNFHPLVRIIFRRIHEFRNRLDATIHFNPLSGKLIERIVDKFVGELASLLEKKKVSIVLTSAAKAWLAEKGYEPKYGARPIARLTT